MILTLLKASRLGLHYFQLFSFNFLIQWAAYYEYLLHFQLEEEHLLTGLVIFGFQSLLFRLLSK